MIILLGYITTSRNEIPQVVYAGLSGSEARAAMAHSTLPRIEEIRHPQLRTVRGWSEDRANAHREAQSAIRNLQSEIEIEPAAPAPEPQPAAPEHSAPAAATETSAPEHVTAEQPLVTDFTAGGEFVTLPESEIHNPQSEIVDDGPTLSAPNE